jgi:hypothetical protein
MRKGLAIGMTLMMVLMGIMVLAPSATAVTVDIVPDTLNVFNTNGNYITAYIEESDDQEIVFADDFELDWTNQIYGEWVVKDDGTGNHVFEARSDGTNRGTAIFAGDSSWTEYTLEARIYTADIYWGLIVRADDTGSTFYTTYLNTAEDVSEIWRHTNGIWTRSMLEKYPEDTPPISPNTWYDMKIEVSSGTISIYYKLSTTADYPITPQDSVTDASPFLSGRIGLIFYDHISEYPSQTYYGWFDNIRVTDSTGEVFFDDFEPDWTEVSGKWIIEKDLTTDGVGHSTDWVYSVIPQAGVEEITVAAGDTSWTDYTLEYKTKITADGATAREGSAFVRADDTAYNGYLIVPQVGSDAGVSLWKHYNGGWQKMTLVTGDINPDTWHSIKVVVLSANIKVFVDGATTPKIDWSDDGSTFGPVLYNGQIGLRQGAAARHAQFDDVVVTMEIDVSTIDVSTIELNHDDGSGLVKITTAVSDMSELGDYDLDTIPDLMVKFDRADIAQYLVTNSITSGEVELVITGETTDGISFDGSDSVRTIAKGKMKL